MAYNPIATEILMEAVLKLVFLLLTAMREGIYSNGGIPEFYGISIMELQEMGKGQRFNKLFEALALEPMQFGQGHGAGTDRHSSFDDASHELIIGLDKRVESMLRAVATDSETGSEFSLVADDQYSVRQSKIGYYGSILKKVA